MIYLFVGPIYIIVEYCENGSLRNYLRKIRNVSTSYCTGQEEADIQKYEDGTVKLEKSQLTPRDLLSFAHQITRGMSYLSKLKIVHRDLAARNILVSSDNVVKVSDFGLSRDVYEGDTYMKQGKVVLPFNTSYKLTFHHIYYMKICYVFVYIFTNFKQPF